MPSPTPAFLYTDAYSGFKDLNCPDPLTGEARFVAVACWAHARRKLYGAHPATQSLAAKELLEFIGELFVIADDIQGRSPEQCLAVRIARSALVLAKMKRRFDETLGTISRKGTLAAAVR